MVNYSVSFLLSVSIIQFIILHAGEIKYILLSFFILKLLRLLRLKITFSDSVAFKSFTISWKLNKGFKTKVITLSTKRSTLTSNEEKKMIVSMQIRNFNNSCSSRLNFFIFV